MKINRIHLENYRIHDKLDVEFDSGINLLLGENGKGKSSILEAIGIPLNDVYIAYMLSDVENGKTCVLVRCRSNKS